MSRVVCPTLPGGNRTTSRRYTPAQNEVVSELKPRHDAHYCPMRHPIYLVVQGTTLRGRARQLIRGKTSKTGKTLLLLLIEMQIANQALWDRLLRIAVGLTMIYVGWLGSPVGFLGATLRVFGPIPLATGLLGWDPLYAILGLGTKKN